MPRAVCTVCVHARLWRCLHINLTSVTAAIPVLLLPSQSVLSTTRTVFGRHRLGHLIPLLLHVKPTSTGFAGEQMPVCERG